MADENWYRRVISSCYVQLIEDLDPIPLLDRMTEYSFFPPIIIRDIKELRTTSDKNRRIIDKVLPKGPEGYQLFLDLLNKSGNEYVHKLLKEKEKEIPKNEKAKTTKKPPVKKSPSAIGKAAATAAEDRERPREPMIAQPTSTAFRDPTETPVGTATGLQTQGGGTRMRPLVVPNPPLREEPPDISLPSEEEMYEMKFGETAQETDMSKLSLSTNVNYDVVDRGRSISKPAHNLAMQPMDMDTDTSNIVSVGGSHVFRKFYNEFNETKEKSMYEGRILEMNSSVCEDAVEAATRDKGNMVGSGGYGDVFKIPLQDKSEKAEQWEIVIKRIQCRDDIERVRSATCEMLAARLMHFAIVPLWAMSEDLHTKTFYFMLPYFENNSLAEKLSVDKSFLDGNEKSKIVLKKPIRLKILYQVACAMAFLHRKIPNFRESYVHRDITTRNIVLDRQLNARLLDFGLAREYTPGKDGVTLKQSDLMGTPGYFRTSQPERLTIQKDVFNFGIVILEVLSSMPPCTGETQLRKKLESDHFEDDFEDHIEAVWGKSKQDKAKVDLMELAKKCNKESITSSEIKKKLGKHVLTASWDGPEKDPEEKRCVVCLMNPVTRDAESVLDHKASCKLYVCVACMRNSYLNPIECHTCCEQVEPSIGHKWAAILVTGNDDDDEGLANVFKDDTEKVYKALTSRHPMTIGIRKENVFRIAHPNQPGTPEELLPLVEKSFKSVAEQGIKTLVFFYSGHHLPDKGFKLGTNEEYLTKTLLEDYIKGCGCERVFIILDCCYAPAIKLGLSCSYYQINSCSPAQQTSLMQQDDKSPFTEFFVQGLKGKSSSDKCLVHPILGSCELCDNYVSHNGFIEISDLLKFIDRHMEIYDRNAKGTIKHKIHNDASGSWKDGIFAYYIGQAVSFQFALQHDVKRELEHMLLQLPDRQEELMAELFNKFKLAFSLQNLSTTEYADILAITIRTGPRRHNEHELDTIEKIEAAWNGKRKLCVSLRKKEQLHNGRVGMFGSSSYASITLGFLKLENVCTLCQFEQDASTEKVSLDLEGNGVRGLWRSIKHSKPSEGTGMVKYRAWHDLEEFLRVGRDNKQLEIKGRLVFTFPQKDEDGNEITDFYSVHVEKAGSSERSLHTQTSVD